MKVSLMFVFSGNFSFETGLLHHHHVIPLTVLLSNIVLNQTAREESLIYCKNWLIDSLASDFLSPNKHTIRYRLVLVSATNT